MIGFLIEKEFKQMMRNRVLPVLYVILPVIMVTVMPRAANQEISNLNYSVVDNDHSTLSQRLVQQISASEYFSLNTFSPSYRQALDEMEAGRTALILQIEQGFERKLMTEGAAKVMISVNAVDGLKGGLAQSYITQLIADYSARLREECGMEGAVTQEVSRINVCPRYLFNTTLDYEVFMVPGMIAMLIILLMGFLPALNVVGEREKGTIEQINVTPVGRFQFIFAKLIPYWIVGVFILTYALFLARWSFGMVPVSGPWWVYLFTTLFIGVVSGMGLLVSNYSDTMQQAALVMLFFLMIFILTSGLVTPIASMPWWARQITYLNPLRYYMEIIRALYLRGSTFVDLLPQFSALSVYLVAVWIAVVHSYKKSR